MATSDKSKIPFGQKHPENEDELHLQLNKNFYQNYSADYFSNKAVLLASQIATPDKYIDLLSKGYEIGKVKLGAIKTEDLSWMTDYAKQEIVINSYHSIESFFRLLFAHLEHPECPWLGLVEMNDFKAFKKRIESLNNRTYFTKDHDKNLANVLLGSKEPNEDISREDWDKGVKNIVDLVDRISHDILSTSDYNAFKHGAALFSTELGFTLGSAIDVSKQETFIYLTTAISKKDGKTVKKYSKTYKFMKWETRFATTYLVTHLMSNMLDISATHLGLKNDTRIRTFHNLKIDEILETGIIVDTISESLFERSYQKVKK